MLCINPKHSAYILQNRTHGYFIRRFIYMSIDLLKEYIKLNKLILETESQSVFESDIIVPDIKPDISELLLVDADTAVDSVENFRDKINVNFTVNYKILYRSKTGETPVTPINCSTKFSSSINADSLDTDANLNVNCDVEHIDFSLLNDRKINTKCIVKFTINAACIKEIGLASGISGNDSAQVKNQDCQISSCIDSIHEKCSISETISIPGVKSSILEILRTDTALLGKSSKIIDGNLIVKGELAVTVMYIAADEAKSIQYMENTLPFSCSTEVFTTDTVNLETSVCLDYFRLTAVEDSDGEMRCLEADAEICVNAAFYENQTVSILDDAYCLDSSLNLSRENIRTSSFIGDVSNQFVLKELIKKSEYAPDMLEIINVSCKCGAPESRVENGRILLESFVKCTFLYLSNDNCPVASFSTEIPYKYVFDKKDIPENASLSIKADVEHINFSLVSSDEAEVRIVICAFANITTINDISVISKISETEISDDSRMSRPSVTIYYVKPDDSIWSVAKNYSTTCDIIKAFNDLDDKGTLTTGMKLVIPK